MDKPFLGVELLLPYREDKFGVTFTAIQGPICVAHRLKLLRDGEIMHETSSKANLCDVWAFLAPWLMKHWIAPDPR
jgi:hypothetical protein